MLWSRFASDNHSTSYAAIDAIGLPSSRTVGEKQHMLEGGRRRRGRESHRGEKRRDELEGAMRHEMNQIKRNSSTEKDNTQDCAYD